jgi:ATP-dependent RNA helicase RhlE
MKTFSDLSLSPLLKTNLARHGFTEPTPVQAAAIEPALAGRNLVATAQTGTGKTLAFVLPVLESLVKVGIQRKPAGIHALILSPTRELALQINETFAKMGTGTTVRPAVVVGGLSEKSQLQSIRKGAQVVIATPGRLYDFLSRKLINLSTAKVVVLDEADRMLDMGFLPTLKRILSTVPPVHQTLFFSATIESSVRHLVDAHVPDAMRIEIGSTAKPCELVDLHFYEVEQDGKLDLLRSMLRREEGSFLVFARTKHGADRLSRRLADQGVRAAVIHGDRSQNQRNQALRGFQDGYYRVLVATDVASRGIHVEGIAHVVNYDLPQVAEDFIHRVGRTGRAGTRGTASTFGTRSERTAVSLIERTLSIRLTRRKLTGEVAEDQKMIEKPRPRRWRSFGPAQRRMLRRAG